MMRTGAGWYASARTTHLAQGGPRPLLLVLDCKGGPDARVKAARTRRLLHAAGASWVAAWPDEAAVSLWGLPPRDLAVALFQMIESGTGDAAYYADITQAVHTLAITAPAGPPADGAEFLARLDAAWLKAAYRDDPSLLGAVRATRAQLPDIALRYRTCCPASAPPWTARETSPGPMHGTSSSKAPANVRRRSAGPGDYRAGRRVGHQRRHEPRAILLACDDYSAVWPGAAAAAV